MKTLNSTAAKAHYLEKLSLLGLRKSDDPCIENCFKVQDVSVITLVASSLSC